MSGKTTFYGWVERTPSNVMISISGGFPTRDAETGRVHNPPTKLAKFSAGMCSTDDPETIGKLRELMAKGDSITEDPEIYFSHVRGPKKPQELKGQIAAATEDIAANEEEIKRLTEQVNKASAAPRKAVRAKQRARKTRR